jgi:hypothetical protein
VNDAYLVGSIANGDADAVRPLIERYMLRFRWLRWLASRNTGFGRS